MVLLLEATVPREKGPGPIARTGPFGLPRFARSWALLGILLLDQRDSGLDFNLPRKRHDGNWRRDFQNAVCVLGVHSLGICSLGELDRPLELAVRELLMEVFRFFLLLSELALARNGQHVVMHADLDLLGVDRLAVIQCQRANDTV